MSDETNAIIDFARAFDSQVSVTATTNGVHAQGSYHYRAGTNGNGLAVDFAYGGATAAPKMLALAKHFETVGPRLAELFHTPLGHSWKNGKLQNFLIADHVNHVHVAVEKGTFLVSAAPAPTQPEDKDMPDDFTDACITPSGKGRWILKRDGAVNTYNFDNTKPAPSHGSMYDYPSERTKPGRYFIAIEPVGPNDEDGYWVFANDGFAGKLKK